MSTELWSALGTIILVWAFTVLTPGPNFFATVHTSLKQGRGHGHLVALGIALGTFIWASASLLGLGILFATAGWLYLIVKICGAAYLIWVGLRLLFARPASPALDNGSVAPPNQQSAWRAFRFGLVTDLANPKAAAFFTSLFAVAVPPMAPLWFDGLVIVIAVVLAGGWYAIAATIARIPSIRQTYDRFEAAIMRITGGIFMAFGVKLAMDR